MRVWFGWPQFLLFVALVFFLTHFLSVLELHQEPTVNVTYQKKTKKFDHLVFVPAAGEGLPNRVQCKGIRAVNKTFISASSNISNGGDGVTFVTVFTVYNSTVDNRSSESTVVGKVSYSKVHLGQAKESNGSKVVESGFKCSQPPKTLYYKNKLMMPESKTIILTDPTSRIPLNRNKVTVYPIPGDYSRHKLMLQRIRLF